MLKQSTVVRDSRRGFLKCVAAAAAMPMLALPRKSAAAETMTLLAWYGHGEPDVVGAWEEANGVKVESKYYTGGDNMLALIAQSPVGSYDVILSDAEYTMQLRQAGYLEKLDPSDYPFDDFFPEFQRFPMPGFWDNGDLFSVPVGFGFLGMSYNTNLVDEKTVQSYAGLWDAKVTGKVGHFDWYLPNLGCLSLYDGNAKPFDISDDAFAKLKKTTLSLRGQVKGFFDYGGVLSSLRSGEVTLMCGIGDWITGVLQKDGAPMDTVIPKEGGIQYTEGLGIGKGAKRQDLAQRFIQYMTSPEGQVRKALMKAYPSAVPNRRAWELLNRDMPEEAKRARMRLDAHNMMDDIRAGRIQFRKLPTGQSLEEWNDFWLEYKNAG